MATATHMPTSAPEQFSRAPVVVVANDQEWAARSLESLLAPRGYAVRRVASGYQAVDLVRAVQPDALIVDARTQDLGALEICGLLRGDPLVSRALPIIVTANEGTARTERLELYAAGAWEYCTQPLDGEVLLLKLATFLRAKQELDRVLDESLVDEGTGLYTLRGLAHRAREMSADAVRRHDPVACVAFAPVRDLGATGKPAGVPDDDVVTRLAALCRERGRASDAFGRVGTSEFAVIAPATDERGAAAMIERLRSALADALEALGGEMRAPRLIVGMATVPDFARAGTDVMEMLLKATDDLRKKRVPALAEMS